MGIRWTTGVTASATGTYAAHRLGVLLRDSAPDGKHTKPANLLLADDGMAKLTDFGLSKPTHAAGTGQEIGYVAHPPPEALASPSEITTIEGDIFAMGVTIYRLLEGNSLLDSMWANAVDIEQEILAGRFPPTQLVAATASRHISTTAFDVSYERQRTLIPAAASPRQPRCGMRWRPHARL